MASGVHGPEARRYIAERIPGATLHELPGGDQLPFLEGADATLAEVQRFLTGEHPVPEEDRVLATILFTDIVGSTERAAATGDQRWKSLLDEHDAAARSQVESHRGRLVKTTGDGILAIFDGPARGVRCAVASRTVTDLVTGSGMEFADRGGHRLKGVPGGVAAARRPLTSFTSALRWYRPVGSRTSSRKQHGLAAVKD